MLKFTLPRRTQVLIRSLSSKTVNVGTKGLLLVGSVLVILVPASPVISADTLNYPWYNAPCEFGPNGGSSCTNPTVCSPCISSTCTSSPNSCNDLYDWYENNGNGFTGTDCWYNTNSECFDGNGYEYRNCTSYTAWRLNQVGVPSSSVKGLGNGGQWYNNSPASERTTTPKAWDAAVVPGTVGHVAFVESVSSDGTQITVSEYNHDTQGNGDTRTGTPSSMGFTQYVDFGIHPTSPSGYAGVGSATFFGGAQLNNGQTLQDGYYLTSGNVQYALIMQADGNLVLYSGSGALWASNTSGNPGAYLGVQSDGNIVIYNASGQAIWATNTNGQSTSYLVIQTDGNLVAYNTSGVAVWASNTGGHSTDTYYGADRAYNGATVNGGYYIRSSDLRYALMMQSDGNLVLYGPGYHVLWANNENGNPGAYLGLQSDGNIVEYSSSGHALWATNTGGQSLNYLVMQSDGNLVAYNTSGGAIWATGTNGKI